MTNAEFKTYLRKKVDAINEEHKAGKPLDTQALEALALLRTSLRIMENSPGPVARRYKRDYLRRLAKQGVTL